MQFLDMGLRIREERERLGFSQAAFSGIAEATRNSQLNWEKGSATPNGAALEAWSKIGVDVLYIITGQRSKPVEDTLSADRKVLLDAYDKAPEAVRNAALAVLLSGGQAPEGVDTSKSRKGRAAPKRLKQTIKDNDGLIIGAVFKGN